MRAKEKAEEKDSEQSSEEDSGEKEDDKDKKDKDEKAGSDEEAAEQEKHEEEPEAKEDEEEAGSDEEEAAKEDDEEDGKEETGAKSEEDLDEDAEKGESSVRTSDFSISNDSPWTTDSSKDSSDSENMEPLAQQAATIAELDCVPGYWEWASHPNPETSAQEVFCVTLRDEEMIAGKNSRRLNQSLLQKKPAAKIGERKQKKRKTDDLEKELENAVDPPPAQPPRRVRRKTPPPDPGISSQFLKTM